MRAAGYAAGTDERVKRKLALGISRRRQLEVGEHIPDVVRVKAPHLGR